ncbi:MAG: 23S rRNA pseudouridine(1911/1915/1917) synthase RluD [Cocleimonas sp.]|nr:23S rRNA pseudouridine(1911/1915/1917) synthase RluD [Cocleimonas sp.]
MTTNQTPILFNVPYERAGFRLDQIVAEFCPQYSRSQLQKWIKSGHVLVDGKQRKNKDKLAGEEQVTVQPVLVERTDSLPEHIDLDVVYEDEVILVINKPAGLVVHPGAGNTHGTLMNGLLAYNTEQALLPRAGIVHRLDKDTTGLMMVAKTLEAHYCLVDQLQRREVKREYLALVSTEVISGATIEANIARNPRDRKKMTVCNEAVGKQAITHYRIEKKMPKFTLLRVQLETGRTHQIRVHLSWKHMPIVGDRTYTGRLKVPAGLDEATRTKVQRFNRQALHATRLTITHPLTGELCSWDTPMPNDMRDMVEALSQADPF